MTNTADTTPATTGHNIYGQHTSRDGLVYGAWAPQAGHKVSRRDWFVIGEVHKYGSLWSWTCRIRGCTFVEGGYRRQYDAWRDLLSHVQRDCEKGNAARLARAQERSRVIAEAKAKNAAARAARTADKEGVIGG
jgi:hypothetical protein